MAKKPFPGVTRAVDRHGAVRWRLRRTVKGRKVDTYLTGAFGSVEFRAGYEAAINPTLAAAKTAGPVGTFNHIVGAYRAHLKFKALAGSTRYAKGKRLDAICALIGQAFLSDLQPHQVERMMDMKGGPAAANRLVKDLSELFTFARKKLGVTVTDPTAGVDARKQREDGFHTWTSEQITQYRNAHPSGTMARLALELMLATGAARQDACMMGRHNIKGDAIYYRRGKTGQHTELPLMYMQDLVAEIIQLPYGADRFITHSGGKPYTIESFGNWFSDQCKAAGLPSVCRAHGLRKHGATAMAEKGATELHIMAFLAHKSTREATRYVRAAKRKTLAAAGMALVQAENVSNLSEWLGKTKAQDIEMKGQP